MQGVEREREREGILQNKDGCGFNWGAAVGQGLRAQISSQAGPDTALCWKGRKGTEEGVCFNSDERWGVRLLTSLTPLSLTVFSGLAAQKAGPLLLDLRG